MITIHLRYQIDPEQLDTFVEYGKRWIRLVNRLGGTHHGYFLPAEGNNDEAFALFSFPSLAAYEQYRITAETDPECIEAYELVRGTGCIIRFERRFQKPLFSDDPAADERP